MCEESEDSGGGGGACTGRGGSRSSSFSDWMWRGDVLPVRGVGSLSIYFMYSLELIIRYDYVAYTQRKTLSCGGMFFESFGFTTHGFSVNIDSSTTPTYIRVKEIKIMYVWCTYSYFRIGGAINFVDIKDLR